MHRHAATRNRAYLERGFTLVELLIAFVLLAIMALALTSAVRAIGQTQERVEERLARWDDQRVAAAFLGRILERTVARKRQTLKKENSIYYFSGAPSAVMWMGIMPANFGAGGAALFRLSFERVGGAGEGALVLRWQPWSGEIDFPDWSGVQSRVMVERVRALDLRYMDAEESGQWLEVWNSKDRLPERIELRVVTESAAWPPIVTPVYQLGREGSGTDGFSFGGAR